jgi:2-polyprenyl-3-methyl-5-hydroxy-6-metoxy-1,4-benzoquinol methylase
MGKEMAADLRYVPGERVIPFEAAWRHHDRYAQALRLLGKYGHNWLDYGCGSGYGTRYLADFADMVMGYDKDPQAINPAIARYVTSGGIIFLDDARNLLVFAPYDAVFLIEVLEHVDEDAAEDMLRNIRSLTAAPEGRLVLTTPIRAATCRTPLNPHHKVEYSINDLARLLRRTGWDYTTLDTQPVTWTDGTEGTQATLICQHIQSI